MAIDDIKDITSGNGFTAAHPVEVARGDSGVAGHKYKPISRWTEHPFQLYREQSSEQTTDPEHLYFGIMAYHAEGIKEVEFFLNGGDGVQVTEQEINPYTNLPEYCVRVNKADVIANNGEKTNNMELRAIVRPVSGVPRIHQHDKDVVLGEDMSLLTGYFLGFSGGKGSYFFDKKSTPGEFSQIGTIAKNESNSVLDSISVYMRPDGVDTNEGTRESPLKTIGKALEVIRDRAAADTSRHITGEGDNAGLEFVDVTRSEIVLLRGLELPELSDSSTDLDREFHAKGYKFAPYTSEHFGQRASERVGLETSTNRTPLCKKGWFIVRGDFDVPREDIILTLTDDEAQLGDNQIARKELLSDFSLLDQNRTLNCFKIEHVFIDRPQTRVDQTELGFRFKTSVGKFEINNNGTRAGDLVGGHTAEADLLWFHDVTIKSASIGQIHPQGAFIKNERQPDQCIFLSGSAAKRSKILGGDEVSVSFVNTINSDLIKNDGDCLKQYSLGLGLRLIGNNNSFGTWRRIWLDPNDPETERYAHFNGYYGAIRYAGRADDSRPGTDVNGSRFFERGTLQEYIRLHNLNTPEGVTLSWPKKPRGVAHPADVNPNASTDDSTLNDETVTGTLWQKINHTNFLDVNCSWLKDQTSEDDFELTTYRYWGDQYRTDTNPAHDSDPYFGNTAEKEPPVLSTISMPSAIKTHMIGPEKGSRFYSTRKSRVPNEGQLYPPQDEDLFERNILTDEMAVDEQVRLASFRNGVSIYDSRQGQLNENNYFYEPKYCAMLKYQDSNSGITAWGQFLFDARKPLAANPLWEDGKVDDEGTDWGITQDFLFRLAGTTFPSAGLLEPVLDSNGEWKAPGYVTDWPYTRAQFLTTPNPKKERGQFDVAWSHGITTQGLSLEHRGTASEAEFTGTPISPQNTHPVVGRANLGSRDTNHVDQSQIHATTNLDSIHSAENVLVAYCDNCLGGQAGQHSAGSQYMSEFKDFAYVNNVWSNIPVPDSDGFQFFPPGQKHILWYHNTMHNVIINYGIPDPAGRQFTFDKGSIKKDTAAYLKSQYDRGQAVGGGENGEPGFTLPGEADAIVFKNNYITKCNNEEDWLTMGLGKESGGIVAPYINPTTTPVVFERNFRWNGGPINGNVGNQVTHMIQLPTVNPPQFKQLPPFAGGSTLPIVGPNGPLRSPFDLIFNYQPTNDSPLVAGGTLGMEDQVPFDINRKRRIGHSTIGAVEVDSSYITANDNPHSEYVAQTSSNSSTNGEELFPPLNDGSTLMSFAITDPTKHKNLYGKRIKVRATKPDKENPDNPPFELFSDNILRLQRDRENPLDEGVEGGNSFTTTMRSLFLEPPNDPFTETYLFNSNNSIANQYVIYSAPSSDDFDLAAGETSDYGVDLEFETIETSASQNPTWLSTSYGVSFITIISSDFQSVTGDRNKIRIGFDTSGGDTQGTTLATQFHNKYAAAGGTLAIPFPNGISFFIDKTAGGMTAHGSSLESYFFTNTTGTTVSLPPNLPTGEVLIEKPTGL